MAGVEGEHGPVCGWSGAEYGQRGWRTPGDGPLGRGASTLGDAPMGRGRTLGDAPIEGLGPRGGTWRVCSDLNPSGHWLSASGQCLVPVGCLHLLGLGSLQRDG